MRIRSSLLVFFGLVGVHASHAALVHRWSFDIGGTDSVGGAGAVMNGGATTGGGSLQLNGSGAYATLPIDGTLASLGSATIEVWATHDQLTPWARIFDFGDGDRTSNPSQGYLFLTGSPEYASTVSSAQFSITTSTSVASENIYAGAIPGPGVRLHYALVIDASAGEGTVFVNGIPQLSGPITLTPQDVMGDDGSEHNWLGRSRFSSDSYLDGSIDEFRIYDTALGESDVLTSYQLGPDVIPEPGAAILAGLGLLTLARRRR
jgi:MYXO-CTERM domain-containing protein